MPINLSASTGLPADTDGTLAADSDLRVATQKATKTYVDTSVAGYDPAMGGDLTGTASNAQIAANVVGVGELAQFPSDSLLGRDAPGVGNGELITVGGGIEFTGAQALQTSAFTGDVTKAAGGTATTIPNDTVTYAKMQNVSAASRLLGRGSAGGAGDPEELTLATGLSLAGTVLTPATASDTVSGMVELATAAEVAAGVDTTRAITPAAFFGTVLAKRIVQIPLTDPNGDAVVTGDGIQGPHFTVPAEYAGAVLGSAHASLVTPSSSGTPTIQIHNVTDAVDMLSTRITIDVGENTSYTAAVPPVIDGANDEVATGDLLRFDVDVAGTGAKGLTIILTFQAP